MQINKSLLLEAGVILAMIGVALVAYRLSPLLEPKSDIVMTPDSNCNLNLRPCRASLPDGGSIELDITPRPIPLVKPLGLRVTLAGIAAEQVDIDFTGIDMNMGYNRPRLTRQTTGDYTGEATLPVCITGKMAWRTTVLVESGRQKISIPFRFESTTH